MSSSVGLNYFELQNKHFLEGYIGSIEEIRKDVDARIYSGYEEKVSLRDKVGEIMAEFLYFLKNGDKIVCQISGEYLGEPYIFISREYLSRKNIAFFYANYGFLGSGEYYYELDINDKNECDLVFELENFEMLKRLVQKYGDNDALALFYIPTEIDEPLKRLEGIFKKTKQVEWIEHSLLKICDFILIFEADGDSIRLKSSDETELNFVRSRIAKLS